MHLVGVQWLGPPSASRETAVPATAILPAVVVVSEVDDPQATATRLRTQLAPR